jgi:hypothetical protein
VSRGRRRVTHRDLIAYVVNADNYRREQVVPEMRALAASDDAAIIGVVEAIGNDLPPLPGMAHDVGSGPSRGNIAAYVSRKVLGRKKLRLRWHDMERTWPRTQGPGTHPSRSHASTKVGRVQVVIAHIPPRAAGTEPARQESIDALVRILAPWTRHRWPLLERAHRRWRRNRPRILLIDANGAADELCRRADLTPLGGKQTDTLLVGGHVWAVDARYLDSFRTPAGVVPFQGDHREVLRAVISVPDRYLPKEKRNR